MDARSDGNPTAERLPRIDETTPDSEFGEKNRRDPALWTMEDEPRRPPATGSCRRQSRREQDHLRQHARAQELRDRSRTCSGIRDARRRHPRECGGAVGFHDLPLLPASRAAFFRRCRPRAAQLQSRARVRRPTTRRNRWTLQRALWTTSAPATRRSAAHAHRQLQRGAPAGLRGDRGSQVERAALRRSNALAAPSGSPRWGGSRPRSRTKSGRRSI